MHFVYKLDHLFQSTRVSHVISSVTKTFHFLSLFQLKTFFASNMQHSKTHTENSTLGDFICYFFMHLMIYFQLNDLEIGKGYNLNSEKVETWHGIFHLTHITCVQKLRGLRQKLDALRVQTGPSLSKYKGF